MKKLSLYLIVFFLFATGSSFLLVTAQEKSKEELDKEVKIQQAIEKQKKVMTMQKKEMENADRSLKDQQVVTEDSVNDIWIIGRRADERGAGMRYFNQRGNRSYAYTEPFVMSPGSESFFSHSIGDSERTTWELSKSVKGNTFSKDYSFDVEKTVKTFEMSVMGDCKSGTISIKIFMPGGKSYSNVLIDEYGNLNWRKSFNISDTDNQDKTGEWKFKIDADNATGFFSISLQAY